MSPAPKRKPSRSAPSDRELRRLYKRHCISYFTPEGEPDWTPAPFSRLVRVVDTFADEVAALRRAMHDPLAPGAGKVIARIGKILGTVTGSDSDGAGRIKHYDSEIDSCGEAIDWHVRGEPVAEVERERARIIALRAKNAHDRRPRAERTREELERGRDIHLDHALKSLVHVLCCEGYSFSIKQDGGGFLSIAESSPKKRREALAWLRRELLSPDATPSQKCGVCGRVDRWPENWPAPDLCSQWCAEKKQSREEEVHS